jgi:hypothetical protein
VLAPTAASTSHGVPVDGPQEIPLAHRSCSASQLATTDALTRCLGGKLWFRRRQQPSLSRSVGSIPRVSLEEIEGVPGGRLG